MIPLQHLPSGNDVGNANRSVVFSGYLQSIYRSNSREEDSDNSSIAVPPKKKRRINFLEQESPAVQSMYAKSRRAMDMKTQSIKVINLNRYDYAIAPPPASKLLETVEAVGIPRKIYRQPFYSDPNDTPDKPREYGGFLYRVKGNEDSLQYLDDWEEHNALPATSVFTNHSLSYSSGWEYGGGSPPSVRQVKKYLASEEARIPSKKPQRGPRSQVSSI